MRMPSPLALAAALLLAAAAAMAQPLEPGAKAPPISVEHLLNAPEGIDSLSEWSDLPHDVVVLEFWGTWCAPCVAAIPHLNDLHEALGDRVSFLSVTYEEPTLVERFLSLREMKSIIGCDTDRSMVDAYGIRAWPTTFVIRDGVIVSRSHPSELLEDRLRAWLEGSADSPVADADASASAVEQVGADGRPSVGRFVPGSDPHTRVPEVPMAQIIIREAGEAVTSGSSSDGVTLLGASLRSVVSRLWNRPEYAVVGPEWIDTGRYDVIAASAPEQRERLWPLYRGVLAATLDLKVEIEDRPVQGYALTVSEGGITLSPGIGDSAGFGYNSSGTTLNITGTSMKVSDLVGSFSSALSAPVENRVEDDDSWFIELTLDSTDPEAFCASLLEKTGLVLTPVEVTIPVAVVSRSTQP